jgi:hypothetical protein
MHIQNISLDLTHSTPPPPPKKKIIDGYDAEAAQAAAFASAFAETKVRSAFVRKVFSLVLLQLAITIGISEWEHLWGVGWEGAVAASSCKSSSLGEFW